MACCPSTASYQDLISLHWSEFCTFCLETVTVNLRSRTYYSTVTQTENSPALPAHVSSEVASDATGAENTDWDISCAAELCNAELFRAIGYTSFFPAQLSGRSTQKAATDVVVRRSRLAKELAAD